VGPGKSPEQKSPTGNELRYLSIEETHRTIRTCAICLTVGVSVWKIVDGVVKLLDKPPWVTVLTSLIAVLSVACVQTPLLYHVSRSVRKFTRRAVSRNSELEALLDPNRTSSGLTSEGEDPGGGGR